MKTASRMRRALVTGATGFIGRRLVDRLVAGGVEVVAFQRSGGHFFPATVESVQGDVCREDQVAAACARVDVVFHLAALVTFDPRRRDELVRVNGGGTAAVLAAAMRAGVKRCVVAGSAATLGVSWAARFPRHEDASPPPEQVARNPYMESKLACERAAFDCPPRMPVVVVNPTTVFGPGDRTLNSGTLFRQVTTWPVLPVPPGGTNAVDVDDVVDGLVAAASRGTPGRRHVLAGQDLTFAEVISTIARVTGRNPVMVPVPAAARLPFEAAARVASAVSGGRFLTPQIVGDLFGFKHFACERARRDLGWYPRYSFADSAARAWEWYRREGLL